MAWWEQTIGVAVGGALTVASNVLLERWRSKKGQTEALRQAYVEWIACAETALWSSHANFKDMYERKLIADTKIRITEPSAERRALVDLVWSHIPDYGSAFGTP